MIIIVDGHDQLGLILPRGAALPSIFYMNQIFYGCCVSIITFDFFLVLSSSIDKVLFFPSAYF